MPVISAFFSKPVVEFYFFSFLLFLGFTADCQTPFKKQKVSRSTAKVVRKISKTNVVMGGAVYYEGSRPKQYDRFEELMNKASEDELRILTNHSNAAMRCYAFWALSCRSSSGLLDIVVNHIYDTSYVHSQFGCIGGSERVGDFFIDAVTPFRFDSRCKKLDSFQRSYLDSILVYTPNILDARIWAIYNSRPTDRLYDRLKELVESDCNSGALVPLAKYRKPGDVPIILRALTENEFLESRYVAYGAVCEFPHPDFFPTLQAHVGEILKGREHYNYEWRELYNAIANYKNEKAFSLLEGALKKANQNPMRKYHVEFISAAINTYNSPIYDDLLWNIWTDEKLVSEETFKYLAKKNPQKTFNLTLYSLSHLGEFHNPDIETLILPMLDLVATQDKQLELEIIRKNLKETYISEFRLFAEKAEQIKDTSFIEPLLSRLNDSNPHVYLKAAEILISYNNAGINQQIIAAKKVNSNLSSGWGGEAFDKLLKENNIQ